MPSVSVIIPTYNRAKLLLEAVDSVLKQTFRDIEIIVVDDGSKDETESLLKSLDDTRIRYFQQPNRGVWSARNAGIRVSRSPYIAFLDDDDLFLPEKLAAQVGRLSQDSRAGLAYCRFLSAVGSQAPRDYGGLSDPNIAWRQLLLGPWPHISTVLVRREWLTEAGVFDESLTSGEDLDLYLGLGLAGCPMVGVPSVLAVIRQQSVSRARSMFREEASFLKVLDKAFDDPRMPNEARALKDLAYSIQLVLIAASAYLAGLPETGREFLEKAISTDITLKNDNLEMWATRLVTEIVGLSTTDPAEILKSVVLFLPRNLVSTKKAERLLWGIYYEKAAFKAFQQGNHWQCISNALRGVRHDSSIIRNRGLVSILIRSIVGNSIFVSLKYLLSFGKKDLAARNAFLANTSASLKRG